MDGEPAVKEYMVQRLAQWVEARDLEKVSSDVDKMVGSLESLKDEKYAKIRWHIYNSNWDINEQFLKDFHTFREEQAWLKPDNRLAAYNQFVVDYPEINTTPTPGPVTPEVRPSWPLIDAEGNWTSERARITYEANVARWALEWIEVSDADLDTLRANAVSMNSLDELRGGLWDINTDILPTTGETTTNLNDFTQRVTEFETRDMVLRSLAADRVRVSNLDITIKADGSIEYTYETSWRLWGKTVSGIETYTDIDALRTALQAKHGWTIPEATAPRWFSAPMRSALENAAAWRTARLRFLTYIWRFK
jgi:hypothetical protein